MDINVKNILNNLKDIQLIGWTKKLWQEKSGELWFLGEHDEKKSTFSLGLTIVDSDFRKNDSLGQCPTLHEKERKESLKNILPCPSLVWFVYANTCEECDIDDETLRELIKLCWGKGRWWVLLHEDMVFIQEHEKDISRILSELHLHIQDFYGFMYAFVDELVNAHSLTSHCHGCSNVLEENEEDLDKREFTWFFKTAILFSPKTNTKKSYKVCQFPYTSMLVGNPPCLPKNWALYKMPASSKGQENLKNRELVANWMPAVLLAYIANESRKLLLGDERDWFFGSMNFKSKDVTWAFNDYIDVERLNFHLNGKVIYDAFMADAFAVVKDEVLKTAGHELTSDEDIWTILYKNEHYHWENECKLKDILPEHIYKDYAEYVEAYFAYFLKKHPIKNMVVEKAKNEKKEKMASNSFTATTAVFEKGEKVDNLRINMLYQILCQIKWINEDDPDNFVALFDGAPNTCRIKWNSDVGLGNLKDLFSALITKKHIKLPIGYTRDVILQSHFVGSSGKHINLRGAKSSKKAEQIIQFCLACFEGRIDPKDIPSAFDSALK